MIGAGAVTLSPYLGRDSIDPFLAHPGRGVGCCVAPPIPVAPNSRTKVSTPGIACSKGWPDWPQVGRDPTVSVSSSVQRNPRPWLRCAPSPQSTGSLHPGSVPKGATLRASPQRCVPTGAGCWCLRRVLSGTSAPAIAAAELRDLLRTIDPATVSSRPRGLAFDLHASGCVRFGEFTLRSGVSSPVYVDLRRLSGNAHLLRRVAALYGTVLLRLTFDHVGAVPYGASPSPRL